MAYFIGIAMKLETTDETSKLMSKIKGHDTKIEVMLRKALWHQGIRYRKNYRIYNCRPDIVITKHKIAIFCDGDFWHGKEFETDHIKRNGKFWDNKIKRNIERDLDNTVMLRDNGWTVLRFWESEILQNLELCIQTITTVCQ